MPKARCDKQRPFQAASAIKYQALRLKSRALQLCGVGVGFAWSAHSPRPREQRCGEDFRRGPSLLALATLPPVPFAPTPNSFL